MGAILLPVGMLSDVSAVAISAASATGVAGGMAQSADTFQKYLDADGGAGVALSENTGSPAVGGQARTWQFSAESLRQKGSDGAAVSVLPEEGLVEAATAEFGGASLSPEVKAPIGGFDQPGEPDAENSAGLSDAIAVVDGPALAALQSAPVFGGAGPDADVAISGGFSEAPVGVSGAEAGRGAAGPVAAGSGRGPGGSETGQASPVQGASGVSGSIASPAFPIGSVVETAGVDETQASAGLKSDAIASAAQVLKSVEPAAAAVADTQLPKAAGSVGSNMIIEGGEAALASGSPVQQVPDATGNAAREALSPLAGRGAEGASAPPRWKTDLPELSRSAKIGADKVAGQVDEVNARPAPAISSAVSAQANVSLAEAAPVSMGQIGRPVGSDVAEPGIDAGELVASRAAPLQAANSSNGQISRAGVAGGQSAAAPLSASADVTTSGEDAIAGAVAKPMDAEPVVKPGAFGSTTDPGAVDVEATVARDTALTGQVSGGASANGQPAAPAGAAMSLAAAVAAPEVMEATDVAADGDVSLQVEARPAGRVELTSSDASGQATAQARSHANAAAGQVAAAIARNLQNGQTRFQMRFDPPELGRVDINMKVAADGSVHAHMIVERPETLDMFLRDQRALERALVTAGLNAESENLQFSLKQDGGQQSAFSGQQDNQQRTAGGDKFSGDEADVEVVSEVYLRTSNSALDIRI
ncbi:flagellar hook-length control protein FliK [Roseibium sp.]|uniref:flagellar hook-length control protein FliK n=1 Tax=Roseibium sp. TaxID=1936156 RepID=UPI003A97BE48